LYKEACFNTNELDEFLPNVVVSLLQEFEDVFINDVPSGLPHVRGIEHQIDFVPGGTIPNQPTYRINPEETKELQWQVEELIAKGHVRESMSPCAVLVLLVPKKENSTVKRASVRVVPGWVTSWKVWLGGAKSEQYFVSME
jgi:hypothetical protein